MSKIDYYAEKADYIHLKWGDVRKRYHFTDKFVKQHERFVEEFEKYFSRDPESKFKDPLAVVNYIDAFSLPVHFYFNYTDTPAKNIEEVKQYLVREHLPDEWYVSLNSKLYGWDGEELNRGEYKIVVVVENKVRVFKTMQELLDHASKVNFKDETNAID